MSKGLSITLAITAAAGILLWLLSPVLMPFVIGILLGYLCNPLVDRLEKFINRTWASFLIVTGLCIALVGVVAAGVPLIVKAINNFTQSFPKYLTGLEQTLRTLVANHGDHVLLQRLDVDMLLQQLTGYSDKALMFFLRLLENATLSTLSLFDFFSLLLVTPLVAFFVLLDWPKILKRGEKLLPPAYRKQIKQTLSNIDAALNRYLRGQALLMLIEATLYAVGLWLVGLKLGIVIGIITGFLAFIPFVGFALGVVLAFTVALFQFQFDAGLPYLMIAAVFAAVQILELLVLQPQLLGRSAGIHPVWVVFAILAGGELGGFLGVLIGLPVAVIAGVVIPQLVTAWHKQVNKGSSKA